MKQLICYCFEYTEEDIVNDFKANHGKSSILAKIAEEEEPILVSVMTNIQNKGDVSLMSAVLWTISTTNNKSGSGWIRHRFY